MQYRSIPVVKEARELTALNMSEIKVWVPGSSNWNKKDKDSNNVLMGLIIPTLEGDHQAGFGDFIIQGLKGEFYPCKAEIFHMSYEPASNPPRLPQAVKATLAYHFGTIDAISWRLTTSTIEKEWAAPLAKAVREMNKALGNIVNIKEENARY